MPHAAHLVAGSGARTLRSIRSLTPGGVTAAPARLPRRGCEASRAGRWLSSGAPFVGGWQSSPLQPGLRTCGQPPTCRGCLRVVRVSVRAALIVDLPGARRVLYPTRSSGWPIPSRSGPSVESETHRGVVRLPDCSGYLRCKERCRISRKSRSVCLRHELMSGRI